MRAAIVLIAILGLSIASAKKWSGATSAFLKHENDEDVHRFLRGRSSTPTQHSQSALTDVKTLGAVPVTAQPEVTHVAHKHAKFPASHIDKTELAKARSDYDVELAELDQRTRLNAAVQS